MCVVVTLQVLFLTILNLFNSKQCKKYVYVTKKIISETPQNNNTHKQIIFTSVKNDFWFENFFY